MKDTHTDSDKAATAPAPKIKKKSGFSLVWLIPIITALIGGWLIFKTLSEKGPDITITFKTAEGIQAGTLKLVGTNKEVIVNETQHLLENASAYNLMANAVNPFGDGLASRRIVDALLSYQER